MAGKCQAWFLTLVSGSAAIKNKILRRAMRANHESDDHQKLSLRQRHRRCHLQFPRVSKKSRNVPPTRLAQRQRRCRCHLQFSRMSEESQNVPPARLASRKTQTPSKNLALQLPVAYRQNSLLVHATPLARLMTIAKRCPRNPLLPPLVDNPANPLLVPVPVRDENKLLINNAVMLSCAVSPRSCAFSPSLSSLCSLFHRAWLHP